MAAESNQSGQISRLSARINSSCYVCGADNSRGLHLVFESGDQGEMSATWTPDATLEGFEGIVHGGIVSTVMDESMAKAVAAIGVQALTAELRVRFRRHVSAGKPYRVRGWVDHCDKRIIRAEATIADFTETEFAHAWSSFLVLK